VFGLGQLDDASHQWFWDGHEHVDPAKEANAQATRLTSNTTTLATEYARQGKDWETELRQRAKEVALCKEFGLVLRDAQNPDEQEATDSCAEDDKVEPEQPEQSRYSRPLSR
jgi:capsid protein